MSDTRKPLLLCQSYGSPEALHETLVCLLSLKEICKTRFSQLDIVLYTDNPEYFKRYFKGDANLSLVALTNGRIAEWKGKRQYVHRLKIKMIEDCFRNHGRSVLYFDSDTYFTQNPEALFEHITPTTSTFYTRISNLVNPEAPDLRRVSRALKRADVSLHGKPLRIPPESELWDCTLLGMHISHRTLIVDVLAVSDELFAMEESPMVEQLAFSFILGQHTSFYSGNEYLVHYRHLRDGLQPLITSIFAKRNTLEGAQEALELVQNPPKGLMAPRKGFFGRLFGG